MVIHPVCIGRVHRHEKSFFHARQQVADLLDCEANEIVFTSGGSEANNLALKGVFFADHKQSNTYYYHPKLSIRRY